MLISLFISTATHASALKATELSQYCVEVSKKEAGKDFNRHLAQRCKGYMDGFFDSMIVLEKISGKKEICLSRALPKTQSNLILNAWIEDNKQKAAKTTAAVALYAAFKDNFSCK